MMAPLPREGMREENGPGGGKGGQDVGYIFLIHVFQELAGPDQIEFSLGNKWSVGKIVEHRGAGDNAVGDGLCAAIHSQNVATQLVEKARGMAFAAADVQHRLDAQLPDRPLPQMGAPGARIAS